MNKKFYGPKKNSGISPGYIFIPLLFLIAGAIIFAVFSLDAGTLFAKKNAGSEEFSSTEQTAETESMVSQNSTEKPQESSKTNLSSSEVSSTAKASSAASSKSSVSKSTVSVKAADGEAVTSLPSTGEVNKWYLKIANYQNKLSKDYIPDTTSIRSQYVMQDDGKRFNSLAIDSLHEMFDAAKAEGVSLKSKSSYRSYSLQETLYANKIQRVMDEEGLPRAEAEVEAAKVVAIPGTSEHALGLAVDINSVETSFENTNAFKWLKKNAEKYGFVLRFPKDKQDITKIIYEPWHWRYVSPEHAKKMNELSMCLEEYVDFLKGQ